MRGFSAPKLIIKDEAAYISDAMQAAIDPMLAVSAGRLIEMSSPNRRRGHFTRIGSTARVSSGGPFAATFGSDQPGNRLPEDVPGNAHLATKWRRSGGAIGVY